jgi:YVTN family beta-propeller protein
VKTSARAAVAISLAGLALAPLTANADTTPTPSNGRRLQPAGRLTALGNFPTGGALTPDGRRYWAVDSGLGHNDVKIVDVRTGAVTQTLPLPGAYGGLAFNASGTRAYVSGEPLGDVPAAGPTKGNEGDVLHVFDVNPKTGSAVETNPIALPKRPASQPGGTPLLSWPEGVAIDPLGDTAVVALNQAGAVAIVDLVDGSSRMVDVGQAPVDVKISRDGQLAYVTTEGDGTVDVVDLAQRSVVKRIPVGGPLGDRLSHPEGLALDSSGRRLYVAVASRDLVAVIDTKTLSVIRYVNVGRRVAMGTEPVAVAVSPKADRLYVADAGEDAIAVVNLKRTTDATVPKGPGEIGRVASIAPYTVVGRIPTAAYPTGVAVMPDSRKLIWLSAKGFGTGPNLGYKQFGFQQSPYGTYTPVALTGQLGVMPRPSDARTRALSKRVDAELHPAAKVAAPPGTPVVGPDGGPSTKIKYVFYVVRENRVYDQIFGTDPRGNGDPKLELFDDNDVPGPTGGVTPNAHKLARMFPLLDNFYADSEVSVDGHIITSGAYAIDRVQRSLHANYGNRGRVGDFTTALSYPPRDFIFDQAARQGVTFHNYGETEAGTEEDDGRDTYSDVKDGTDSVYQQVASDAGSGVGAVMAASHSDTFATDFQQQLVTNSVPQLNYLTLPLDHTLGTTPGIPTPKALVANNDLGLGQIVSTISHSSIWPQSAIFVVEDDAQDGADHVDSHRMPAFVISPWAKKGAVIHTRYDQYSVLRTIELILGLKPLALGDALATPMFDAFSDTPDAAGTVYDSVLPQQSLAELNTPSSPDAAMSAKLPFDRIDAVPEEVLDRILWHSVYGESSTPPAPGPNASPAEHTRAAVAMRLLRTGGDARAWLVRHGDGGGLKVNPAG